MCWIGRPDRLSVEAIPWTCMVIRRSAFLKAGGFGTELSRDPVLVDLEFCRRLAALGWNSICDQNVTATFPLAADCGDLEPAGASRVARTGGSIVKRTAAILVFVASAIAIASFVRPVGAEWRAPCRAGPKASALFAGGETLKYGLLWPSGVSLGEGVFVSSATQNEVQLELKMDADLPIHNISGVLTATATSTACAPSNPTRKLRKEPRSPRRPWNSIKRAT